MNPLVKSRFVESFQDISNDVNENAVNHGWWEKDRSDGEIIALMHSELSESLEALRMDNPPDKNVPEFTSLEVELADVIIRIMDYASHKNLNVGEAIIAKHEYNKTRPYKHGKKF